MTNRLFLYNLCYFGFLILKTNRLCFNLLKWLIIKPQYYQSLTTYPSYPVINVGKDKFIKGDGINNSSYKGGTDEKSPLEKGARGLWINDEGQLVAETELGAVKFTKPIAYQIINGKRVDVSVEYRIQKSELNPKSAIQNLSSTSIGDPKSKIANHKLEYGFRVASYDKTLPLIIDPLLASTYLGGSDNDSGYSLALDTSGNVYVTGYTISTDFPTTSGVYGTSKNGSYDVFVSKFNSGLTE